MAQHDQPQPGLSLAGAVDLGSLKHQVDAQPGQAGGAPAAGGYVIDVTEASFPAMVQTSATYPILLLLWLPTDDRLFPMARALADAVNGQGGKLQLARVDVSAQAQIAQALQAKGAPALYALLAGRPMPILEGLPSAEELQQITDQLIPQIIQLAQQQGITGSAPYQEGGDSDGQEGQEPTAPTVPPAHQEAHRMAQEGDYAGAARAYAKVLEGDPGDQLAARERAKALLMDRSAQVDVREARQAAADRPDDADAQMAAADVDMIGGKVEDAMGRLIDFIATHKAQMTPVHDRLLEYFSILEPSDPRLAASRRRLATSMY
ncbi:thioredoxin [Bifidobacterium actinocoloniiforme DSM 22766]|uniref:Thioredoxin n=1 Tax=Bifidobacterium actinocoloniiforme DSM 22766 TaxID=1437605 RepID=A0A086YVS9_9BIFI|nr:tetratricopeptide repeat protein [Bifidobacterium actinocoloniiforme]AKV54963.1 thioredoxin [Bifidobacterium actinocoloniiforme DSM 22766]KFI38379.1 thioredoxin [Bifidobacterium actinocoloniiforme DSM 22766]